ncbi:Alpha/beta hydrolase fold-5 [Phytophthora cactorum]|nr:Alpha/beta hydrolase fold-5 [Phytophthora cactorum]
MVGTRMAAALGVMTITRTMSASAQNMSFGADNFYRSNNVTIQPITFPNQFKMNVAGNLFTPKNLDANGTAPAIIVGHPMGAVKEQSANLYATKMADQGFVTVSIDLSFWGGSDESRATRAAVDYLSLQNFIDSERIGALGICGSGSFAISAAKIDSRIKAVATSSMYDMGAATATVCMPRRLSNARRSSSRCRSNAPSKLPVARCSTQAARCTNSPGHVCYPARVLRLLPYVRGEYTPPGSSPNVTTHPTLSSTAKFMNFYPLSDIDSISPRRCSHSREFSEDAYAGAAEPKELYWVAGAGHVDLYDRVDLIPFDKFTEFFTAGLAANATQPNW